VKDKHLISEVEFRHLVQLKGNTDYEGYEKLLIRNGFSYRHPRTRELIIGCYKSTREQIGLCKKLQPCTPYNREANRSRGVTLGKCEGYHRELRVKQWIREKVKLSTKVGRKLKTFRTIWYSSNNRRK